MAGGAWPAKQRARTHQALKKRGRLRVGLPLSRRARTLLSCCHAAVTLVQLASWPGRPVDTLRAACVGRRRRLSSGHCVADSISGARGAAAAACLSPVQPEAAMLLSPPATFSSRSALRKLLEALRWPVKGPQSTIRLTRVGSVATAGGSSLVRVSVRIIALHATAVHKLLKLLLNVRERLAHWAAAGGGDDGAASCPAGGVLLSCQAAEARSGRKARSRAGGGWVLVGPWAAAVAAAAAGK